MLEFYPNATNILILINTKKNLYRGSPTNETIRQIEEKYDCNCSASANATESQFHLDNVISSDFISQTGSSRCVNEIRSLFYLTNYTRRRESCNGN